MDAIPRNLEFLRNHPNRMKLSSCSSPFSLQDQAMSLRIIYICMYVAGIVVNLLKEISTCVLISRSLAENVIVASKVFLALCNRPIPPPPTES